MAKTLQHSLTVALMSMAVALAAPAYAAKYHQGTKTIHLSKHNGKISGVEMRERQITAQLNRNQLGGSL